MAKKKAATGNGIGKVEDYRHTGARRKNNPPAQIAAEGSIPTMSKIEYAYSPRRPPVLRIDTTGRVDKLPELLAQATSRKLTTEEARLLGDALRTQNPWLEWAGKQESEAEGFSVDPLVLHIHERISAQAILKVAARQDVERSLFGDPEQDYHEAVQFYRHDIDWSNRIVLGDSLQVMASLSRREDLAGKVQMMFIDPPYGIKFGSNFQPEVGRRDVQDRNADLTREPEMVKAFRDTWHLGIHSYLSYLRNWLVVAKELLADSGSIFLQINDANLHLIRMLLDDVFGPSNAVLAFVLKKKGAATPTDPVNDFIVWYAKDRKQMKYRGLYEKRKSPEDDPKFNTLITSSGAHYRLAEIGGDRWNEMVDEGAEPARVNYPLVSQDPDPERSKDFVWRGQEYRCGEKRHWTYDPITDMHRLASAERVFSAGVSAAGVTLWSDWPFIAMSNVWDLHGDQDPRYVVQTNRTAIARCMWIATDPGDLVLDPTCGSGSTAYVAEQLGRRWITIDTSRVAVAIARQRLLTAKFDYYKLRSITTAEQARHPHGTWLTDPHGGHKGRCTFDCKKNPRISLKRIAQNQNLDPIFAKHEPVLEKKLAVCNAVLGNVTQATRSRLEQKLSDKQRTDGKRSITDADRRRWKLLQKWEHWQVPFDTDLHWPGELVEAVTSYRNAWHTKMDEVNACIAANAEQEELIDQPEVAKGVVRVSGPFSVEAVQPGELSLGDNGDVQSPISGSPEVLDSFPASHEYDVKNVEAYLDQMMKLLRMDGVRFPDNKQRDFSSLIRMTGSDGLHAEGRWVNRGEVDADPDGRMTVAVAFGPQYGPVTATQVEKLIRAASRRGYDDLVVAGFSFDGLPRRSSKRPSTLSCASTSPTSDPT